MIVRYSFSNMLKIIHIKYFSYCLQKIFFFYLKIIFIFA
jgi:hypothetical protein